MVIISANLQRKTKTVLNNVWDFLSTTMVVKSHICLFVCFVALRPKSTAMVIAGQSVHLTTLFPGQA